MNGLAPVVAALLAALLSGCAQLSAFKDREADDPVGLAREALEAPAPPGAPPPARRAAPVDPEPFRVEVVHADLWDRLRAGFRLGPGPDDGIATELAFYSGNGDFVQRALERGRPYLHHIVERLERRGMPLELALLPVVESAFQPTAYSRAKASGLWQFIPATGKRFGLTQNRRYDGRRDVIASTEAALDYLSELHARFGGDWLLALAAYNWGERNVERAIEANRAAGRPTDYWSLSMPAETRAYVPRLFSVARMVKDPARHALSLEPLPNRPWFAVVEVARDVRLADVARELGLAPAVLEGLNAGYRHGVTGGGSHTVVVPVAHAPRLLANMDALETARAPAAEAEPEAAGQGAGRQGYRIRRGDTLGTIARRFGVSVAELQRANGIRGHAIHAGQRLDIPATAGRAGSPPGGETRLASAGFRGGKRGAPAAARMHTVARGDTLWQVSRRYDVAVDDLAALNGLARSAVLAPGQKLVVAKAAPAARAPAPGRSEAAPANTAGASTPGKGRTTPTAHYAVRSGDSLWTIARRFEVSVDDLCRWNGVGRKARLAVGQRLVVQSGN